MSGLRNLFKQYPSKSSELSGSDVEKEYKSRIESFVYEVTNQGPKSLKGGGDLLEKLFQWSQDAHNDRTWFRSQYQNELEARKGLEEECRKLKRELSEKRDQILAQEDQILAQEDQIRNLVLDHSKKLADEKGRHKIEVEKLRKEHMDILAAMEKDHQKVKRILDAETNRLRGELLVNVGEAKAWTDDTLRSKLITLQTKVQAITTVNGFKLDNTVPCSPHLEFDATQFLKRSDGTKVRVFLRNAIWSVLYDHFFARPFGFGVLGPVSGKDNPLLCALISWQSAIDGTFLHSNLSDSDECMFANFYTSQEANEWRSVTFESAYGAIMSQHGSTGATSATAQLSNTNVGEVKSRIIGIFQSLSQCSKPPFALPSEENISTVATLARQIAYQFGVNTNQLRLLMPQHGDKVQIGAAYHDYHNGDVDASISVTVDQVFSPGLQKLPTGHGGGDSSAMTLVPCQICDLAETSRSRKP